MESGGSRRNYQDRLPPLSPFDLSCFFAVTPEELKKPWPLTERHIVNTLVKNENQSDGGGGINTSYDPYTGQLLDFFRVGQRGGSPKGGTIAANPRKGVGCRKGSLPKLDLRMGAGNNDRLGRRIELFIRVRTFLLEWLDADDRQLLEASRLKGLRLERNSRQKVHQAFGLLFEFQKLRQQVKDLERSTYFEAIWLQV